MAEIVLDQIGKRFSDGTDAVKAVSLTIRDGEFFILVGPSGCGKSTLLNMIVGLEDVTEGEIRVDGRVMNEVDPKDRNMAMVFQSYALYPHMTVRDNIAFPLKLAKLPKAEMARRVEEATDVLGLSALLDRKPRSLSGGQRQRVAMGRAIVRRPSVFLLDEPLSNLDAKLRVQMRTEIARIQRRLGTTTVYVTHDQTEAMTLGDRVAVLNRGALQQIGTPRELYERPRNRFVAGFIGAPAMNFLPAEIQGDRLKLPIGEIAWPLEQSDPVVKKEKSVIVGIRPEDFKAAAHPSADPEEALHLHVTADVVEWLGAELYVHFEVARDTPKRDVGKPAHFDFKTENTDKIPVVARLDASGSAVEGQALHLSLDCGKVHVFDAETGARVDPRVDPKDG